MARANAKTKSLRSAEMRRSPELARTLQFKLSSSGVPFDAKPTLSRHGGARLKAGRTSDHLSLNHARAIMQAALTAERIGEPFTRMVNIHWQKLGIEDHQAAKAIGRLTKLAADWARRRGARILWAWVRENGKGSGSHVHLLLACPRHLPIGRMLQRWLRAITGKRYPAGAILTERIGGTLSASVSNPAGYHQNLLKVAAYLCKSVKPENAAILLGLHGVEDGGTVIGKRSAVCPALLKLTRTSLTSQ